MSLLISHTFLSNLHVRENTIFTAAIRFFLRRTPTLNNNTSLNRFSKNGFVKRNKEFTRFRELNKFGTLDRFKVYSELLINFISLLIGHIMDSFNSLITSRDIAGINLGVINVVTLSDVIQIFSSC